MEEAKRKPRRHRRGEGSTFYDKDAAAWIARLSLGIDRKTGKRRQVKRTARTQDDAERELARLRRWYGRAGDAAFTTLDDYLITWLDTVAPSVSASTLRSYTGHVELHISPLLGMIHVGALRPADVHRLIADRLRAGLSPATVQRIITTLRMALHQAVRDGDLIANVAQVKLPRVRREPIEALTPARAQLILDAVRGDRLEALYVLLLGTGMRVGEACALDWRDVDLEHGSVFIREGKTPAARRTLPLPAFVVAALRGHRSRATRLGDMEPVFTGERKHERLRVDFVTHHFPALLEAAGLPRMRAHDLRHGTATLLLQRGVPMRDIADILGHANPSVTANTYAHVSQDSKRRAMDSLDDLESPMRPPEGVNVRLR